MNGACFSMRMKLDLETWISFCSSFSSIISSKETLTIFPFLVEINTSSAYTQLNLASQKQHQNHSIGQQNLFCTVETIQIATLLHIREEVHIDSFFYK